MKSATLVIFLSFGLTACSWTPLQLSLWEDLQMCEEGTDVVGARLGLAATNRNVDAIDIGLGATFAEHSSGLAIAPFICSEDHVGINVGLFTHVPTFDGVSIGLCNNLFAWLESFTGDKGTMNGVQIGVWSYTDILQGIQLSALLNAADNVRGMQFGVYNAVEKDLQGVQVGLFNSTTNGFQIGLLNFNENGFLPWFPLFNF